MVAGLQCIVTCAGADSQFVGQRQAFRQAEQALARGDQGRYAALRDSLAGYPLLPHLEAKRLATPDAPLADLVEFLNRFGSTRPAIAVRSALLDRLARAENWSDVLRYYADTGDVSDACDYWFARLRQGAGNEVSENIRKLWDVGHPQPARCDRLFAAWRQSGLFTLEDHWRRLGLALQSGELGLAERLAGMVSGPDRIAAETWLKVHSAPSSVLNCAAGLRKQSPYGRVFAHAVTRLANDDPWLAQRLWNLRRSEFDIPREEQARVDKRLAMALAAKRNPVASAYLNSISDRDADEQVRGWRVRAALAVENWPLVLSEINRLSAEEQRQSEWRYWRARAQETLGAGETARADYAAAASERDFFGFLAADRLGRSYSLRGPVAGLPLSSVKRLQTLPAFAAVLEWLALDRPGEARRDWMHGLKSLSRDELIAASYFAQQLGQDHWAIVTAGKAEYWDDVELRFPLAYRLPVVDQAERFALDPAAVYGIIRRESAFDRGARSGANAQGLMQLLPATAEQVARRLGDRWTSAAALYDPNLNIRYGAAFLAQLLRRFDNHLALAVAAYNAGPGNVQRWLPQERALPVDQWVETIPFSETRQYVQAVLAYRIIYRARLGLPALTLSHALPPVKPVGAAITPASDNSRIVPVTTCPAADQLS